MSSLFLKCAVEVATTRDGIDGYLRPFTVDICVQTESDEIPAGRIQGVLFPYPAATVNDVDLFDMCDSHSQLLHEISMVLFNSNGEYNPELGIEDTADHVLVIEQFHCDDAIRPYLAGPLDVLGGIFGFAAVIVAEREVLRMSDEELAYSRFLPLGDAFVFADRNFRSPYSDEHPQGVELSDEALQEYEDN